MPYKKKIKKKLKKSLINKIFDYIKVINLNKLN